MIIYKITNKINGAVYVGQTTQILKKRWNDHKKPSNKNCPILSKAIAKYGAENFTIEEIDRADEQADLDKKEIYWISFYRADKDRNYNYNAGGRGNRSKHTEETKNKLSQKLKGKNNPNWGIPKSERWKKHMSSIMKGRPVSEETKTKIANTLRNRKNGPRSEETKRKISEAQKGKPRNQKNFTKSVICLDTGIEYKSIVEAAKQLGFTNSQRCKISAVCLGKRKMVGGKRFAHVSK
jgi:group I intron endonuclease